MSGSDRCTKSCWIIMIKDLMRKTKCKKVIKQKTAVLGRLVKARKNWFAQYTRCFRLTQYFFCSICLARVCFNHPATWNSFSIKVSVINFFRIVSRSLSVIMESNKEPSFVCENKELIYGCGILCQNILLSLVRWRKLDVSRNLFIPGCKLVRQRSK